MRQLHPALLPTESLMRKLCLLATIGFISCLLPGSLLAQRWHSMQRYQLGFAIPSPGHIHICCSQGWLLQSWDGAKTWTHQRLAQHVEPTLSPFEDLKEIVFADSNVGLILGTDHLYRTTDGGHTWQALAYPGYETYSNLVALPDGRFCFVDAKGRVYKGRTSWIASVPNDSNYVHYLRGTTDGYLIGITWTYRAIVSPDGGITWNELKILPKDELAYSLSLVFTDHYHGVFSGQSKSYATKDGGLTWKTIIPDRAQYPYVLDSVLIRFGNIVYNVQTGDTAHAPLSPLLDYAPAVRSKGILYAMSNRALYASIDTGRTVSEELGIPSYGFSLPFRPFNDAVITVLDQENDSSYLYRSLDSGVTWKRFTHCANMLIDHVFLSDSVGMMMWPDSLYRTSDEGSTWKRINFQLGVNDFLSSLHKLDKNVLVVSQQHMWVIQDLTTIIPVHSPCSGVGSIDTKGDTILISGYDSLINPILVLSYDAGSSWKIIPATPGARVQYIERGVLAKIDGSGCAMSQDAGQTWKVVSKGGSGFFDLKFFNSSVGIVSGSGETYSTLDGGSTWRTDHTGILNTDYRHLSLAGSSNFFMQSSGPYWRMSLKELLVPGPDTVPPTPQLRWYLGQGAASGVGEASDGSLLKSGELLTHFFRSTNRGLTWASTSDFTRHYAQATRFYSHGSISYAFGFNVYRSPDGGKNWTEFATSLHADKYALLVAKDGRLLLGGDAGLFSSTSNDTTFNLKDTLLSRIDIQHLAMDSSGIIYAASFDSVFRSTDNGKTWGLSRARVTRQQVFTDIGVSPSGRVFVATWDELYCSADGLTNWIALRPPATGSFLQNQTQIAVLDDTTLFASGDGTSYTRDAGLHWIHCDTLKSFSPRIVSLRAGYIAVATTSLGVATTARSFGTSGVHPFEASSNIESLFLAYPNPTTGLVRLYPTPRVARATIYDEMGESFGERAISARGEVDLKNLASGRYTIVINGVSVPVILTH